MPSSWPGDRSMGLLPEVLYSDSMCYRSGTSSSRAERMWLLDLPWVLNARCEHHVGYWLLVHHAHFSHPWDEQVVAGRSHGDLACMKHASRVRT